MPRSIQPLLQTLLDEVVAGYAAANVALPSLRYVAPAFSVAYDSEQVTTNVLRLYPGQPGLEASWTWPMEQVFTAEIQVTICRNAAVVQSTGAAPPVGQLNVDAATFCTDVDTLSAVLINIVNASLLTPTPGVPVMFLGVVPYGPEGGMMATLGKLQVLLV